MKNPVKFLIMFLIVFFVFTGCKKKPVSDREDLKNDSDETMMEESVGEMMDKSVITKDEMMMEIGDTMMKSIMITRFQYSGDLKDVSGAGASGLAQAVYEDGEYRLMATFENLPIPKGSDFYEGWIVRKKPMSVISTGRVEMDGGIFLQFYASETDLTGHDFYVLTLEPDDNDPAPALHILEGTMTRK